MPPSLATLLTASLSLAFLFDEGRRNRGASYALWLPTLWLLVSGSRSVSQWLHLGEPLAIDVHEGSTVDAVYFGVLLLLGIAVLMHRSLTLGDFARANLWVALFLAYGLISLAWSDHPFIGFKRWSKALGHPVMAMIVVTDPDPVRALRIVLRRFAFLLLSFSILLIKYFPQYGRDYDPWVGTTSFVGVALQKNNLGQICLVSGLFSVWELSRRSRTGAPGIRDRVLAAAMIVAAAWLLDKADSATSLVTLLLGACLMLLVQRGTLTGRALTSLIAFCIPLAWALNEAFDLVAAMLGLLGRDPTLTDRTLLWRDLLALQGNPLFGIGYESFWLGFRLEMLWDRWWWHPNQAHNGYVETYLNLGIVGVFLLVAMIVSAYSRICRDLLRGAEQASLQLALLVAIVLLNLTESSFHGMHVLWTLFYLVALRDPAGGYAWVASGAVSAAVEHDEGRNPEWQR